MGAAATFDASDDNVAVYIKVRGDAAIIQLDPSLSELARVGVPFFSP